MNGFVQMPGRGKGSHGWFQHSQDPSRTTAVPDRSEIGGDLLAMVLRQSGKTREEFLTRLREV